MWTKSLFKKQKFTSVERFVDLFLLHMQHFLFCTNSRKKEILTFSSNSTRISGLSMDYPEPEDYASKIILPKENIISAQKVQKKKKKKYLYGLV